MLDMHWYAQCQFFSDCEFFCDLNEALLAVLWQRVDALVLKYRLESYLSL